MFDTVAASRLTRRPALKYRAVLDQARGAGGGLLNFAWTGWARQGGDPALHRHHRGWDRR
jgi:hypothetical protein